MKRYVIGGGLAVLLTAVAAVWVSLSTESMPRIVDVWPLALAVGASVLAWVLQGVISAMLARPHLGRLKVRDMVRIYLAGAFIGGISPIRGAEIPYEVYLLSRLGLSAGEGTTVIVTRGLLNVLVLTLGALAALAFTSGFPAIGNLPLLGAALALGGVWAFVVFLIRRRRRPRTPDTRGGGESSRADRWRERALEFLREVRGSFLLLLRREHRTILLYSALIMVFYWAVRLSFGPLALMAGGWSGDWAPVVVAQLLLSSFVLPLAPTPGGSGAMELGFASLLTVYVASEDLSSGVVIYAGLTHYLPVIVGAFFVGRHLLREVERRRE